MFIFNQKKYSKIIENEFERLIEEGNSTFWRDFNVFYVDFVARQFSVLLGYLESSFGLDETEKQTFAKDLEESLVNQLRKTILRRLAELSSIIIGVFNRKFWYDSGIPKNFKIIEESRIRQDFGASRDVALKLLDIFCVSIIITMPFKCIFLRRRKL